MDPRLCFNVVTYFRSPNIVTIGQQKREPIPGSWKEGYVTHTKEGIVSLLILIN